MPARIRSRPRGKAAQSKEKHAVKMPRSQEDIIRVVGLLYQSLATTDREALAKNTGLRVDLFEGLSPLINKSLTFSRK